MVQFVNNGMGNTYSINFAFYLRYTYEDLINVDERECLQSIIIIPDIYKWQSILFGIPVLKKKRK